MKTKTFLIDFKDRVKGRVADLEMDPKLKVNNRLYIFTIIIMSL